MDLYNFKRINWRRVVLNLRSYAGVSANKIEQHTAIKSHKIYRMTAEGAYTISQDEGHKLLDLHYDLCERLHTPESLIIK